MEDFEIRDALGRIRPPGRDILRKVLIFDQADRDRYIEALQRSGPTGETLADLLELASEDADIRRNLARLLGELASMRRMYIKAYVAPGKRRLPRVYRVVKLASS